MKELAKITSRRELLKQGRNLLLALPLGTALGLAPEKASLAAATAAYNYAAALQMSIYLYDAQKSGPGVGSGLLDWRGDSELPDAAVPLQPMTSGSIGTNMSATFIAANRQWLDPTSKGTIDVSGGFHDAGDHVKFGLPQGYAISTLGWGFYEFHSAYVSAGQDAHMLAILRWGCDYLLRSTFRDNNGNVVAFNYQVGEGSIDHTLWAPPEVESLPRPAYFATSETPASDVSAEAAAALAIMYLNVNASDATYAAKCLDTAKALYTFAVAHRGLGYSGGFYNSSYDDDHLAWAAIWLYIATNQTSYLNDIIATSASGVYTGYLKKIMVTTADGWQNIWVHSWDAVWGGVFIKLAPITNDTKHWYIARWNLEYWASVPHQDPTDTNFLAATPAGFKVINTWGSCRYNTAAQLCALVYRKYTSDARFSDWALGQMNYILGTNPMSRCYMVGFAANSAKHPHHRAAHGSFTDSMADPVNHRHTLWGGLVGGPDTKDYHDDATTDFVYNEVGVDYSAAFVGALAGHYFYYGTGQTANASFSTQEAPVTQYFIEALVNQESTQGSQITVRLHGDTSQPPHFETDMKIRYFFDITELLAAGQTISNVSIAIYYDQEKNLEGPVVVRGPLAWNGSTTVYYAEFDWTGYHIWGTRDLEFGLNAAIGPNYLFYWNASNDWSRTGLTATKAATQYIPVYLSGKLIYGQEPPVSSATPTPTPTPGPAALKAQFFASDTSASTSTLRPNFQLVNTGGSVVSLSAITLRYWYTEDGTQAQSWACDYAQVGATNVTGAIVKMSTPTATADSYLQIGFTSGAGVLAAGQGSGPIQGRINKSDYTSYNQTNDWSFNGTATSFTDNSKVTVYQSGKLIYGTEPS
jgi:hypothetical protein